MEFEDFKLLLEEYINIIDKYFSFSYYSLKNCDNIKIVKKLWKDTNKNIIDTIKKTKYDSHYNVNDILHDIIKFIKHEYYDLLDDIPPHEFRNQNFGIIQRCRDDIINEIKEIS